MPQLKNEGLVSGGIYFVTGNIGPFTQFLQLKQPHILAIDPHPTQTPPVNQVTLPRGTYLIYKTQKIAQDAIWHHFKFLIDGTGAGNIRGMLGATPAASCKQRDILIMIPSGHPALDLMEAISSW